MGPLRLTNNMRHTSSSIGESLNPVLRSPRPNFSRQMVPDLIGSSQRKNSRVRSRDLHDRLKSSEQTRDGKYESTERAARKMRVRFVSQLAGSPLIFCFFELRGSPF